MARTTPIFSLTLSDAGVQAERSLTAVTGGLVASGPPTDEDGPHRSGRCCPVMAAGAA